jgi:hypothetical protein
MISNPYNEYCHCEGCNIEVHKDSACFTKLQSELFVEPQEHILCLDCFIKHDAIRRSTIS